MDNKIKNSVEDALKFASKAHKDRNQKYGDQPYSVHLKSVIEFGKKYIHHIPKDDQNIVLSACAGHDLIEDVMTYNDVKKVLGYVVAEIIYALTNEKGRTRKDRANWKYYKGIRETKYAKFVKFCDRLANLENSSRTGSKMLDAYKKEHYNFVDSLTKRPQYYFNMIVRVLGRSEWEFNDEYDDMIFEMENYIFNSKVD